MSGLPLTLTTCKIDGYINLSKVPEYLREGEMSDTLLSLCCSLNILTKGYIIL